MAKQRLDYYGIDPTGINTILDLQKHITQSGIPADMLDLIYLRVSQINGCSYCVDQHWKDASKKGVDGRKINGVSNFRHMPFFSDREKAALIWAEEVTHLPQQEVAQEIFDAVAQHFTPQEMVTLTYAVSLMGAMNRIAIASGKHPA